MPFSAREMLIADIAQVWAKSPPLRKYNMDYQLKLSELVSRIRDGYRLSRDEAEELLSDMREHVLPDGGNNGMYVDILIDDMRNLEVTPDRRVRDRIEDE